MELLGRVHSCRKSFVTASGFEEDWIPSCQLTMFRVGDEAPMWQLQADSMQGSGNDLSSRASLALPASTSQVCALLALVSPWLWAGARAPCRWPRALVRAVGGSSGALLGCVEMWRHGWHHAPALPPASVTLCSNPAHCSGSMARARQFSLLSMLLASPTPDPEQGLRGEMGPQNTPNDLL